MSESSINVTEGSGKRLQTWDRTVSSTLVQAQFTLPAEYPYPTYSVFAGGVSAATGDSHLLAIMAGSTNYVRIRRIRIEQAANATSAAPLTIQVLRLTTAGTGGTDVTPAKFDTGDAAAGATAKTLPTGKGTESTEIMRTVLTLRQAVGTTTAQVDDSFEWIQQPNEKPIIIAAGTSNGIAFKNAAAAAGATIVVHVEFVETAYL